DALADPRFRSDLEAFVAPLVEPGRINSLAQTLIKLTAPGVPDLYQGTELWTLTLVDPDNRAPVDYTLRRRLLDELEDATPEDIWRRIDEGLPKLWTIRQALGLRRGGPELAGAGGRPALSARRATIGRWKRAAPARVTRWCSCVVTRRSRSRRGFRSASAAIGATRPSTCPTAGGAMS